MPLIAVCNTLRVKASVCIRIVFKTTNLDTNGKLCPLKPKERDLNGKDHGVKVIHHADRVNLYDYGYEKSGSVKGDPDVYASYLNRIINGDLVEEPYKGFSDDERKSVLKQIKSLEKQVKERDEANVKIDTEVKEKEKSVEKYRKDLLQIREERAKDKNKMKGENFSVV
ncbi:MAG: hypothetical protein WDO15_27520 [Bacteroidota bacterium]